VYYTTSSTFSATTQFGTAMVNPATGNITFTGSQTLASGSGNYFWLVYDVACSATATNTLNGSLVSVNSTVPVTVSGTAPSANAISALPTGTQSDANGTTAVNAGAVNVPFVQVNLTGPGACTSTVTDLTFTVSGTSPSSDAVQAKLYYTTTSTFNTATPFGSAFAFPSGNITFTGSQTLAPGSGNYFWLVFDVACGATAGNTLNASLVSVTATTPVTVTGTAPSANAIAVPTTPTYYTSLDGDWNNPAIWSCGTVPATSTSPVVIGHNVTITSAQNRPRG
jgi:hypothetical protein